jgi:cell division transport system permease protein
MRAGFLVNEVVNGLRRNVTMTIAMILTTAISIGLFGGGLLVIQLANQSRNIYLDRVESQVFLSPDVSANDPTCDAEACKALRAKIEARDDVKSVRFLNRDDAYTDAITKFPEYKDVASKDSFPASFIVKLNNPEEHNAFDAAIVGQPGVLNVLNQKELIDRLFAVLDGLSKAAFAIAVVQAISAILLIANMVQVAAYTRRTEIGIMRMVGATRWYTQLPFLLEAVLAARYAKSGWVRVMPADPAARLEPEPLNGSNMLELRIYGNAKHNQAVLVARLDNLGKGASGAAVQNLGLMLGVDVSEALPLAA